MKLPISEQLKKLRKTKNITQEALAEIVGVSYQSVSRWEQGVCYPDIELLPTLANFYGVTIDSLLSNDSISRETDLTLFRQQFNDLEYGSKERLTLAQDYYHKYPDNDYCAYSVVCALSEFIINNENERNQHLPSLVKTVERLLETQYRYLAIEQMVVVSDESDLQRWLDLCPYHPFTQRGCLVYRYLCRKDSVNLYVQQGIEAFERFVQQLDRRFPDESGPVQKAVYQREVLSIISSFGDGKTPPDGWMTFFAYKQFVLSACLFGNGETDAGWNLFDTALQNWRYAFELENDYLDLGGKIFSDLKISRNWSHVIDASGEKYEVYGVTWRAFHDGRKLYNFLTDTRWSWYDTVRHTEKYENVVKWAKQIMERKSD